MGKEWSLIQSFYRLIERTIKDLEEKKEGKLQFTSLSNCHFKNFFLFLFLDKFYSDNLALALLLKGCCLRSMGSPLQAEECFLQVSKMEKLLQDDTYLIPCSVAELGFLYLSQDKTELAIEWLEAAK